MGVSSRNLRVKKGLNQIGCGGYKGLKVQEVREEKKIPLGFELFHTIPQEFEDYKNLSKTCSALN